MHVLYNTNAASPSPQFQLPHPFAVVTVDGEQTFTTSAVKKTLNPYWNETFEL
jgi:E3 ubiquitin-protein ligase NEDD4